MKYYMKFLLIAVAFGIIGVIGYMNSDSTTYLSDIILTWGFNSADYYMANILPIIEKYIPLILFQVIYGTYIYRRFCSASVYFFSRHCNRTIWFLKETLKVYLLGVAYLILLVLSGALFTSFFSSFKIDSVSIPLGIYYILIYSLFLLVTTLGINIFSILFTSDVAFVIVEGINLFAIAIFTILGHYFITQDELIDKYIWMIKGNPFSHLVLKLHSSKIESLNNIINEKGISFDLNFSVFYFFIVAILVIGFGCIVVNRHNFIESNKETGGV